MLHSGTPGVVYAGLAYLWIKMSNALPNVYCLMFGVSGHSCEGTTFWNYYYLELFGHLRPFGQLIFKEDVTQYFMIYWLLYSGNIQIL